MAGKAALRIFQKTWRSASSRATRTSLAARLLAQLRRPRRSAPRTRPAGRRARRAARRRASSGQPAWAMPPRRRSLRLSIISIAPGTTPAETMFDTACPACAGTRRRPRACAPPPGVGTTRTMIFVATPSVPSEPTKTPQQVVAGQVELLAAQLHDRAVGEHDLQAAHVVRREAVLEAVRAAGVLGHVAADRAHDLARRVGRVEVRGPDRGRDRHVRDAGLARPRAGCRGRPRGCAAAATARSSTPSSTGSAPPDRPLPEPRATHGTPAAWQARTTAATSSPVPGSTAAPRDVPRTAAARRTRRFEARGAR